MEETDILLQKLEEKYGVMERLVYFPFSESKQIQMLALACDMHSLVLALQRIIQAEMVQVRMLRVLSGRDGEGV